MPGEQDARMLANDPLKDRLPARKRQRPEIVTVVHEAIEGVEHRFASAPQQLVKLRPARCVQHDDFAVEDGIAVQRSKRLPKRGETLVRIAAPGNELNGAADHMSGIAKAVVRRSVSIYWRPMLQRVAHYQVLEKLGEGGMGVVYKARDTRLERFVALKVLPADKVSDKKRKLRFVQEAKAASALNHPNIITIYDINSDQGVDFIAMEYVAGRTLDRLIPRQGMRPAEVLRCGVQVADALTAAHAAGIIHRDLKPGNIMITDSGLVKLLDFGLAKLTEKTVSDGTDVTETLGVKPETEEGHILGTIAYMSPEHAQGLKLDARSDIFSFGAVAYEMLTGLDDPDRGSRVVDTAVRGRLVVLDVARHAWRCESQPAPAYFRRWPIHLSSSLAGCQARRLSVRPGRRRPD